MEIELGYQRGEHRELRQMALDLATKSEEFRKAEQEFNEQKKLYNTKFKTWLNKNGYSKAYFMSAKGKVSLTYVQPTKVVFNIDKLKKALDKDTAKKVIEKEYIITDIATLKQLLQEHGVKVSDFKRCIQINETVNEKELDNLSELGEIDQNDLEGTYERVEGTEYVKLTRTKKVG